MPVVNKILVTSEWIRGSFENKSNRSDMRRFIESVEGGMSFKERGFPFKFSEFEPLTVQAAVRQGGKAVMIDAVIGCLSTTEEALSREISSWRELSPPEIVLKAQGLILRASQEKWSDRVLIFAISALKSFEKTIPSLEFPMEAICNGMPVLFNRAEMGEGREQLFVHKKLVFLSTPQLEQLNTILFQYGWWALKKNGLSQLGHFFDLFIGPVIAFLNERVVMLCFARGAIEQEAKNLIEGNTRGKQKGKKKE